MSIAVGAKGEKKMPRYIDVSLYEDCRIVCNSEDKGVPVKDIPTADVQEVRHGKWEKSLFAQDFFRCSLCSAVWNRKFEYCPHCGAKMDGKE